MSQRKSGSYKIELECSSTGITVTVTVDGKPKSKQFTSSESALAYFHAKSDQLANEHIKKFGVPLISAPPQITRAPGISRLPPISSVPPLGPVKPIRQVRPANRKITGFKGKN